MRKEKEFFMRNAFIFLGSAAIMPNVRKGSANRLIEEGNEHYRKGRLAEAVSAYNQALNIEPENPVAWNNKGLILAVAGNFTEALKCHMKAVELDPGHVDAISNVGMTYTKLDEHEKALLWYDKALQLDPDHETTWNNKGNLLSKMDRYEEAMKCYERALAINPNYMAAMNNMAVELIHLKDFDRALSLLNNVLKSRPLFSEGWYVKGKAYIGMGQFDKAIVCLERAHRLNPDFLQAKRALDVLRKKLVEGPGEKEKAAAKKKAVTQSEKAKNEKSVQTEIMHPQAEADIVSDEFKRPEELLTNDESTVLGLITDEPVTAAKLRAAIGSTLSKPAVDRALEGLEKKVLVRAEKEGKTKKYSRTHALGSLTEEIIEKKEETEHLESSSDIHALISRAKKYIDGGRSKEAADILKKALKINPYDDMAICLMSQAQYDMGDRDRAINTISRILSRRPDYIPAWFTLANATLKSGEYSDAAECFRKILELQPDNAEARKGLSAAEKGSEKS